MKRPNILMILADDLGWMDIGAYGSQYYRTPNLDKLASRGTKFTSAYSASPLCSPTRASIMTGKDPARLGITSPACHLPPIEADAHLKLPEQDANWKRMVAPVSARNLPPEEFSLGKAFQTAGYDTALMGKWHLGLEEQHWPRNHGFRVDQGAPNPGPPSYFSPYKMINFPDGYDGQYLTDHLTDEALKYLEEERTEPFFFCLWHFAVHAVFEGPEHLVEEYDEILDPRGLQDCPTMGAMIQSMDENIGRVLDKLDELGIREETIVVFVSDNGGNMYDEIKGTTPTNNAPLKNGKGNIHEGGVRVPFIVDWPGVTEPGSVSDELVVSTDIYPTFLEMAGLPLRPEQHVDGVSFVPVLKGEGESARESFGCHFPHYVPATQNWPATSIRRDQWKLIRFWGEGGNLQPKLALYNLDDDIGEAHNLAEEQPELAAELDREIDDYLDGIGISGLLPQPNPAYDATTKVPWERDDYKFEGSKV